MTELATTAKATPLPTRSRVEIVDCDVHPLPRHTDEIREYLPEPWPQVPDQLISSYPLVLYMPPTQPLRRDAFGPAGEVPGSDPEFSYRQLIDEAGVDLAILLPLVRNHANPEYEAALCQATNDWLHATWLTTHNAHGRFRGSINVCGSTPVAAAREIDRLGGDPTFVQVRLNAYAGLPYGDPFYDPIYEAACRHDLPVAVHFSKGSGMSLLTPVGLLLVLLRASRAVPGDVCRTRRLVDLQRHVRPVRAAALRLRRGGIRLGAPAPLATRAPVGRPGGRSACEAQPARLLPRPSPVHVAADRGAGARRLPQGARLGRRRAVAARSRPTIRTGTTTTRSR